MLTILQWLASFISRKRLQPAYAPARRLNACWISGVVTLAACSAAQAQVANNQLKTMGLDAMWRAQLQMPMESGSIVSTHLFSSPDDKKVYAELTLPVGSGVANRTLRVSASQIGANGEPIGIDAAKKEVEIRAARLLGRASGVAAVEVSVPMIHLIVVSSDGLVQTYDAETGEQLWRFSCGPVHYPAAPASVNELGIAVAQGPELYLLDVKTGKLMTRRHLARASSAGVAMVGNVAFVSSLSGQLVAFDLTKPSNKEPWQYRLFGRALSSPVNSDSTHHLVAFATDHGIATVLTGGEKIGPWFNVKSRADLSGPMSFVGGALYLSDVTGQVSKIGLDRLGSVQWRLMLGESLGSAPVVINKVFYATNEVGDMIAADDATGYLVWPQSTPRVKSILAGNKDAVYCRSLTDRLLVVDAKDGRIVGQSDSALIGTSVINQLTDRLYLISPTGVIQCARQSGTEHVLPVFHEVQPAPTQKDKPKAGAAETAPTTQPPAETEDAADPFGAAAATGDATMAPEGSDPFATPP